MTTMTLHSKDPYVAVTEALREADRNRLEAVTEEGSTLEEALLHTTAKAIGVER